MSSPARTVCPNTGGLPGRLLTDRGFARRAQLPLPFRTAIPAGYHAGDAGSWTIYRNFRHEHSRAWIAYIAGLTRTERTVTEERPLQTTEPRFGELLICTDSSPTTLRALATRKAATHMGLTSIKKLYLGACALISTAALVIIIRHIMHGV